MFLLSKTIKIINRDQNTFNEKQIIKHQMNLIFNSLAHQKRIYHEKKTPFLLLEIHPKSLLISQPN